ncbi:MAG TPA: O-antigen ligase family protein [Gaiellaceae bacterium]|nr:O-antigen ligase family protein [Gaiellaceae bacterium]
MYGPQTADPPPGARELVPGLLAAFVVAALAADAGGYGPPSWGWSSLVLLGSAGVALVLGFRRLAPLEWALPALLAGLTALSLLSLAWSSDTAETVREGERLLLYVAGVSALLLLGRRSSVPWLLASVGAAITGVCAYALGMRLFSPGSGAYQIVSTDPDAAFRLARPLGYANALACFAAIGILLALGFALRARSVGARGLASAALVVLFPTLYFTYGRGAWVALVAGLVALIALEQDRVAVVVRLLALVAAPAVAVALASRTHALTGESGALAAATRDGRRLALAIALLALAASLVPAGLNRASRRLGRVALPRTWLIAALVLIVAAALTVALIRLGGPDDAARRAYRAFNAPAPLVKADPSRRLFSLSGNSRSEYWRVAWREYVDHPWLGGGAGSYQRYWLRHRRAALPVRNAHSLYLETLAELGPLGLALLLGALAVPLVATARARRHPLTSAALGAYAVFLVHAGIDWDWEMTAVTLAALSCGVALLLAARGERAPILRPAARAAGGALVAVLGVLVVLAVVGNRAQAAAADALDRADAEAARTQALRARRWEPWSGAPWRLLGEAELELGRVEQARSAFRRGLAEDRGDWELWLDLALTSTGAQRREALGRVAQLNPLSPELEQLRGAG